MEREAFGALLKEGPLLLDGGMGSLLIAAGLEDGRAPEHWVLEHPERVEAAHRAYVEAGSRAIQTNTFGASPPKLAASGLEGRCREVNRLAVSVARSAAAGRALVAGDIGPTGLLRPPMGQATECDFLRAFREQVSAFAEAGADFISIETMFDLVEALAALQVAVETGLPVVASMTFEKKKRGFFTIMGTLSWNPCGHWKKRERTRRASTAASPRTSCSKWSARRYRPWVCPSWRSPMRAHRGRSQRESPMTPRRTPSPGTWRPWPNPEPASSAAAAGQTPASSGRRGRLWTPNPRNPMPELSLALEPEQVRRYLGYGGAGRPSKKVQERLLELWECALGLLKPRGDFRILTSEEAAEAGMPSPAKTVGAGLCTIGGELEAEGLSRSRSGAHLDALILDAVGSAAAEAAADALNANLCAEAGRAGLFASPRVSPGYGRWAITCQPKLLALLPARDLGISLTEGLMMVPRKSVSFAVNFVKAPSRGYGRGSRCARCGLRNCPYSEGAED